MSRGGRRAALPGGGGRSRHGLLPSEEGRVVVRCFAQDGTASKEYDFTDLPVAAGLRDALVTAFVKRTAPGAGLTSLQSTDKPRGAIVAFARYLAALTWPPTELSRLTPEHLDGFFESRKHLAAAADGFGELKRVLVRAEGLSEKLVAKLSGVMPSRLRGQAKSSYSREEFKRIADAARADLRAAAQRIRHHRDLLIRHRAGEIDADGDTRLAQRLRLLDWADRFADVPRTPQTGSGSHQWVQPWVFQHGSVLDVVSWLHLTGEEAAAGAVLLAAMTGENPGVVLNTPAAHHRADGHTGQTGTAIVGLRKLRRGSRAHMDLALSEIPDWISVPGDPAELTTRDELHTPFGLYVLLHELTARSRQMAGGNRLLIGFNVRGSGPKPGEPGCGRGLRPVKEGNDRIQGWGRRHGLMSDSPDEDGNPTPLRLTLELVRLTYLELHQKPVAHTEQTLATTYLSRNRGNVVEYQKVVAQALTSETAKARARGAVATMTTPDAERARTDPESVAAELGVDTSTLKRMLGGELDTVMAACTDNTNSPHAPAGQPCRASFMLCLECECARALPRHLPVQVLVHDRLAERREQMAALDWARRFSGPHAQLADILDQHGESAVADARHNVTDADHALVERFLNRELDLR